MCRTSSSTSPLQDGFGARSRPTTARLSVLSGLAWALVAWSIGHRTFGQNIWGGIIIAPLIGILIGRLSSPLHDKPRWAQIAWSLFALYLAACGFAGGMAVFSIVVGHRTLTWGAALIADVLAVLWGLTLYGYALFLWPLSCVNHRLVWQVDAARLPPS
jgi:hypothetical protein